MICSAGEHVCDRRDDITNEIGGGNAIRRRGESVSAAAPHSMLTVETGMVE
jgi:hypothetical protein